MAEKTKCYFVNSVGRKRRTKFATNLNKKQIIKISKFKSNRLPLHNKKTPDNVECFVWRRRRDSNSCYAFAYYSLSRGAPYSLLGTSPQPNYITTKASACQFKVNRIFKFILIFFQFCLYNAKKALFCPLITVKLFKKAKIFEKNHKNIV